MRDEEKSYKEIIRVFPRKTKVGFGFIILDCLKVKNYLQNNNFCAIINNVSSDILT